jgi:hypothetical protein
LFLLSASYLFALRHRSVVWFLVFSKVCAVIFLLTHYFYFAAPQPALLAGLVDGLWALAAAAVALREGWHGARESARVRRARTLPPRNRCESTTDEGRLDG